MENITIKAHQIKFGFSFSQYLIQDIPLSGLRIFLSVVFLAMVIVAESFKLFFSFEYYTVCTVNLLLCSFCCKTKISCLLWCLQ